MQKSILVLGRFPFLCDEELGVSPATANPGAAAVDVELLSTGCNGLGCECHEV